ncbi:hypothetical protein K2Y11_22995 [bacterium]|nr:hypothetical protein [bacterium]
MTFDLPSRKRGHIRHRLRLKLICAITLFSLPAAAMACLWDHDTLQQERARFPSTLELITGKFLRHSPDFYRWRIEDRLNRLEKDGANAELLDDLAVAYQKTGQTDKAIETMERKELLKPGLYETYANLGTFYILNGEYERGLPFIEKALAVNPDAHFGRELYQKYLVEYILFQRRLGNDYLPLRRDTAIVDSTDGFAHYLAQQSGAPRLSESQARNAIVAILGMMRFADHDNPVLLEVLGDLLIYDENPKSDAKLLACRCYLMASNRIENSEPYRRLAEQTISLQTKWANSEQPISLAEVERHFETELAEASLWYDQLHQQEIEWIQHGKNADQEFDRLYSTEPQLPPSKTENQPTNWYIKIFPIVFPLCLGPALIAFCIIYFRKRRTSLHPERQRSRTE